MTKEERAKLLLDVYEAEKDRLAGEYEKKQGSLTRDISDEYAEKLVEINRWYEKEAKAIEHRFLTAISRMEG